MILTAPDRPRGSSAAHGPTWRYGLCGLLVELTCPDPGQAPRIDGLLQQLFAFEERSAPEPWLRRNAGLPEASGIRLRFQDPGLTTFPNRPLHDPLYQSSSLRVFRTEAGFLLAAGSSTLDLDLWAGVGTATLRDEFWASPLQDQRELFLLAMVMLLHARGRYALHATGAAREAAGLLLIGPSGSGKTTAALALARAGWSYLSDDALVLRSCGDSIEALALRRGFSCSERTIERFPECGAPEAQMGPLGEEKRLLDPGVALRGRFTPSCHPRLLLFPRITGEARSRLTPLDQTGAILGLLPQAAGITAGLPSTAAQLDVLKSLAHQARSYRLLLGADVLDQPSLLPRLVSSALDR